MGFEADRVIEEDRERKLRDEKIDYETCHGSGDANIYLHCFCKKDVGSKKWKCCRCGVIDKR